LDYAQQEEISKLQARNREVRAHEAAHQSAGGQFAGAVSYTYQRGPNGKLYAVGGEVPIQIVDDPIHPQKTIARMRQVVAAALAPANPSSQDRAVAARATQIMLSARRQLSGNADLSRERVASGPGGRSKTAGAGQEDQGASRSAGSSLLRLYSDVAQLAGTPFLNSRSPGIVTTA